MKFVQVLLSFIFVLRWTSGEHFSTEGKSRFFNNKALRKAANYMYVEANPCKNFYEYACGNWAEEHVDVAYNSAAGMMGHEVINELAAAVGIMNYRNKTGYVKNVMDYFSSCTSTKDTYDVGNFIVWLEKHEKFSWQDTESNYNWAKTLGMMRKYGMNNVFLFEDIKNNVDDVSKMTISLNKPESTAEAVELTLEALTALSLEQYLPEIDWNEVIEFNERVKGLYNLPKQDHKEVVTVKKLPHSWMKKYLAAMFGKSSMDPTFVLEIQNIDYLKELDELLNEYEDEFIFKYLQIQFLVYLTNSKSLEDKYECMKTTVSLFPLPTNWIYEQQHPEIVEEFPKIFSVYENIMAQINQTLHSDESGVIPEYVFEFLNNIQLKVGNLPRVETIHVLESLYSDLSTNATDFYGNHLKTLSFNFKKSHTVNTDILTSNASQYFDIVQYDVYYRALPYSARNVVIVPTILLRQPYYHWGYSDFSIYSTLGVRLTKAILIALEFGLGAAEEKVVEIAALHIALDTFLSHLPEDYQDKELVDAMQKAFILKAAQYFCDDDSDQYLPKALNDFIPHSNRFSELFECKFNKVLAQFSQH